MTVDTSGYRQEKNGSANGIVPHRTPSPTERASVRSQRARKPDMPIQFKVSQLSASPSSHNDSERSVTPDSKRTPKSKGLNMFAVSPLASRSTLHSQAGGSATPQPSTSAKRRSSVLSNNTPMPLLSESDNEAEPPVVTVPSKKSPPPNYDIPLPSSEQLLQMSIDDQLRILALKEMAIVQIKDQIQSLNAKLRAEEGELHKLREVVQRSLYQEISGAASNTANKVNRQRTDSNPRDQAIESIRAKRRSSSGASLGQEQSTTEDGGKPSKLWSGLTKPFNMLQQFDTMLQNEFEKSLVLDKERQESQNQQQQKQQQQKQQLQPQLQPQRSREQTRSSHQSRNSEDSTASTGSISSPLRYQTAQTLTDYRNSEARRSDDMIQTVSSSIWSFVNDVKQNVLSSLNEEEMAVSDGFDVDDQSIDFSMYKR
ncbi:TDA11 [Candida margitis]|uniref:TDA11 n=1 Tax=Candida margitis TaxID=1775924 RepID=UPI002226920A|nr:TDA11 [Candida margitis]KAI5957428.1 TDA11 [Candida margitis]